MIDPVALVYGLLVDGMTVEISTEIPSDRPDTLISVRQSGDQSDEFILRPSIVLMCWGVTDLAAHSMAIDAIEVLREAALDHDYLFSVDVNTLSRDEWTKEGKARYIAELSLCINTDE